MLCDLHCHSSGISTCCRIDGAEVLRIAKEIGLDAVVLTNHYQSCYIKEDGVTGLIKRYTEEYESVEALGKEMGIRVFFGIEVTAELYPAVHMLVYGVGFDFLHKHPECFGYTQHELYAAVGESGGTLIQAHPFRNGATVLDVKQLDGIEINCHPLYGTSCSDRLIKIAEESGLILTCGGDFHADTYRPRCGTYLPDGITDSASLGEYLRSTGNIRLLVHEPNTKNPYCMEFVKK